MQKIWTEGKGEMTPIAKDTKSVTDVMVMDTAASLSVCAMRSGTGSIMLVRRQAASITNVSSIPIPDGSRRRTQAFGLENLDG